MGRLKESVIAREESGQPAASLGDLIQAGIAVFCWCNRCAVPPVVPRMSPPDRPGHRMARSLGTTKVVSYKDASRAQRAVGTKA
jgi:hypothetical protein